jgi:Ser/Thr protein kinase RdoA (MazF antagonist)
VHDPVTVNFSGIQHSRQGVESELRLLQAIAHGTDLLVQEPVTDHLGQSVTELLVDGSTRCCSLLRWIEGRDMTQGDLSTAAAAYSLGAQVAKLHAFFGTYNKVKSADRPDYGAHRAEKMLTQIRRGVDFGLFSAGNFAILEQTLALIVNRLKNGRSGQVNWGIIHADLNMSNILVTPSGRYVFIDYCLSGFGYLELDAAMAALIAPRETREHVIKGYYGRDLLHEEIYLIIESFMLISVLGYYAFVMENEAVHPKIRERLPQFCDTRCAPFLKGERIFLSF